MNVAWPLAAMCMISSFAACAQDLNLAYPVDCQSGDSMLNYLYGPPRLPDDASRISAGLSR